MRIYGKLVCSIVFIVVCMIFLSSLHRKTKTDIDTHEEDHSVAEILSKQLSIEDNTEFRDKSSRNDSFSSSMIPYSDSQSMLSANPCRTSSIVLLTINSKTTHFNRRLAIRKTWGNGSHFAIKAKQPNAWRTVFIVGKSTNVTIQRILEKEAFIYGDLVLTDILEHVKNLTQKTLFGMRWAVNNCRSKFYYKGDDDVFVNAPKLFHFLLARQRDDVRNYFIGRRAERTALVPCRIKTHKYYVSYEDYKPNRFPQFCSGFAYVMSFDVLDRMVKAIPSVKILQSIDDVYIGLLAEKIKVVPRNHFGFHVYYPFLRPNHHFSVSEVNRRFAEHGIESYRLMKQLHDMALRLAPRY